MRGSVPGAVRSRVRIRVRASVGYRLRFCSASCAGAEDSMWAMDDGALQGPVGVAGSAKAFSPLREGHPEQETQ